MNGHKPAWARLKTNRLIREGYWAAMKAKEAALTPSDDDLLGVALAVQCEVPVVPAEPAQPAEPVVTIAPEEREAELRAEGERKEQKPEPTAAAQPEPAAEPNPEPHTEPEPDPGPEPGMPTEPTPGELWANERCSWRPRLTSSFNRNPRPGRCITEYDVLTGEIIGDGYDPRY